MPPAPLTPSQPLAFIPEWLNWAEPYWNEESPTLGHFGPTMGALSSFPTCGYFAACALIAAGRLDPATQARMTWSPGEAPRRAGQALRFILATHRPAPVPWTRCDPAVGGLTQNVPPLAKASTWGHHWGSGITIERIANFVDLAKGFLPPDLHQAWLDMLACESEYQLGVHIETNRFCEKGETHGERNYWRGSLLFRAARLMPSHPSAQAWLQKAASFFANAMSTPEDATSDVVMDGKPLRELHIGANAHPGCVFEHHGAFSSDYSVINASFHAMAMLGALRNKWPVMDTLSLHQDDLWRVIRHLTLPGGRIACIGKQRPRYTIMYCYLLPILALRMFGPDAAEAAQMLDAAVALLQKDRDASADGSFYSSRCQEGMERWNPDRPAYYYRLEADAILSLGLVDLFNTLPPAPPQPAPVPLPPSLVSKDAQLVTRRTPHGFYAVNWKRLPNAEAAPALALVIPSSNPHLTDCLANLETRFFPYPPTHSVRRWSVREFDKGFATAAVVMEARALLHEDTYGFSVEHSVLFALLPDDRSFLMWQRAIAIRDSNVERVDSLNLNIARDIFNDAFYTISSQAGQRPVGAGQIAGEYPVPGPWANISGQLAVLRLAGAEPMVLRTREDRNRAYATLRVDLLACSTPVPAPVHKGQVLIENAWLFVPNLPAEETAAFHEGCAFESRVLTNGARCLAVALPGGRLFEITADFAGADLPLTMDGQGAW